MRLILALFLLIWTIGCTEDSLYANSNPTALSDEVVLTQLGKSMPGMKMAASKITFSTYNVISPVTVAGKHTCLLSGATFTAKIVIPAVVVLPTYGASTPPFEVECWTVPKPPKRTVKVEKYVGLDPLYRYPRNIDLVP